MHTNAVALGTATATRPALTASRVRIYRTARDVPGRYEEVALLNASGNSASTDEARMLRSMQAKAGQVGANAIILDAISEPSAGAKVAGAIFGVGAERKGRAVAIYVFPPSAPPPSVAVPVPAPITVDTLKHASPPTGTPPRTP